MRSYLRFLRSRIAVGGDRYIEPWWLIGGGWCLAGSCAFAVLWSKWALVMAVLTIWMLTPLRSAHTYREA